MLVFLCISVDSAFIIALYISINNGDIWDGRHLLLNLHSLPILPLALEHFSLLSGELPFSVHFSVFPFTFIIY